MPISLGSNIPSLRAQRSLDESAVRLEGIFQKLASGQRINRGADDAAGLSIQSAVRTDKSVFSQGVRNLNDGISLLNIADGTVSALTDVVIRIRELAEQAANGTFTSEQRLSLDAEAQALAREYQRIISSTRFNNLRLLDGSVREVRLQAGYGVDGSILARLGGAIGDGTFGGPHTYSLTGTTSDAGQLIDVNGDGNLDMVAGSAGGGQSYTIVRLGDGTGAFGSATSYLAQSTMVWGVSLADLNQDGAVDLVSVGQDGGADGSAIVRLNDGFGTFGPAVTYSTESDSSRDVTLGDLNGDGFIDLVTAGRIDGLSGLVMVRLGTGTGTFLSATSYPDLNHTMRDVQLGDVNGDGVLDLVAAGYTATPDGYFIVRLGTGSGTFGASTSYTMESEASTALELKDFNNDGILDVLTSGRSDGGAAGTVSIRLGTGSGTFGARTSFTMPGTGAPTETKALDANGDGALDLAIAGGTAGAGYLYVLNGNGDGTFAAATSYAVGGTQSNYVAVGDVNSDGVPDIVTFDDSGANAWASVWLADAVDGAAPLLPFSLRTAGEARQAMGILDNKLRMLGTQLAILGASQSRVGVAGANLEGAIVELGATDSRISDIDVASETAELARVSILQNASAAILAQANAQPAIALALLQL